MAGGPIEYPKPPPGSDPATWYYLETQRLIAELGRAHEAIAALEREGVSVADRRNGSLPVADRTG